MSAMDMYWAAPPVIRTMCAIAVPMSIAVHMQLLSFYWVPYLPFTVFRFWPPPQLWRFVTSFLLTTPKLGLLLDPYFLFTYGKALETGSSRFTTSADFLVFIVFICSVILLLGNLVLGGITFMQPLTLALAYLYAQENPESQMTFYFVTFRIKFLPYLMLAMTMVMDSPMAAGFQATGLVAAHLYDFLTRVYPTFGRGSNPISTPAWLTKLFDVAPGASANRAYGQAFQARPSAARAQANPGATSAGASGANSWTSSFSNNVWGNRGPGRRLG